MENMRFGKAVRMGLNARFDSHILLVLWATIVFLAAGCAPIPAAAPVDPASEGSQPANPAAVENMRKLLARQMHIDPAAIEIAAAEAVEWPDACLGLVQPTELCAPVVTLGNKITFAIDGQEYIFHTDWEGYRHRIAAAPEPNIGVLLMAWGGTFDNGECMEALLGSEGVAFGMCGGRPMIGGAYAADARLDVLNEWITTYAAFDAETDFGSMRLVGAGEKVATPEETQLLGRWAQMVAMEAAAGESRAGMSYQGPAELGSPDTAKCAMLQISTPSMVGVWACDGTLQEMPLGERAAAEWIFLRDHLAPFILDTATETVTFDGMGNRTSEVWQRAVLAWARARYAELATGQTGTTVNTALSWYLGQDMSQRNICMHLTGLDYGYATAEEFLCEGQDPVHVYGGWLTTDELTQLDRWLYDHATLYHEKSYIDGRGAQAMSETEVAEVDAWAGDLWQRLKRDGEELPLGNGANPCPEAQDGLATVRDYTRGFCLLVPAAYTVLDTDAAGIAIVKDTLLNVTDPRLHISVLPADGRGPEEIAGELLAPVTGMDIQSYTTELAGKPAVVIDKMPGQDINRRVIIVDGDRYLDLTFTPMDNPATETFYDAIMANFVLLQPE